MDYEELRPFVLDFLKATNETQALDVVSVVTGVESKLLERGLYSDQPETLYGTIGTHRMPEEDMEKVRQIISELVNQDVLTWGWDVSNPAPPFLRVTKYGRQSLQSGELSPHDPDGYLANLRNTIPTVDGIILLYVSEALQAYLKGLMLSSTIMLGGAAEKAFLLLIERYTEAISDPRKKEKFKREASGFIKRKIDAFNKEVPGFRSQLPRPLADDLDIQLQAVFNLIRTCRNDVGHPTGRRIERGLAFANLQLFTAYCKRVYDLMAFFQSNSI